MKNVKAIALLSPTGTISSFFMITKTGISQAHGLPSGFRVIC